ncbi:MAG: ABC transporter ATP-binding protein/permease [Clostridiales bacterium]|jgi:ATP-binding cassette subfamily B protein|nr:ABC transporter ATP-binding protein/permease [Clostridiales bacterium]
MSQDKPHKTRRQQPKQGGFGGGPISLSTEKAKNFKGTIKALASNLAPYKVKLAAAALLSVFSVIFSIAGPKILSHGVNEVYNGYVRAQKGQGGVNMEILAGVALCLIALYFASLLFSFTQAWIITKISQELSYNFRRDIAAKINRLPLRYFDGVPHGEVMSRVTNDVDTISQTLNQITSQIITSLATILGIVVVMLTISPTMTLVAVLVIPASFFLVSKIVKLSQKHFATQQKYLGRVNGHVEEVFSGHNIVKAFCAEEREIELFNQNNKMLYSSAWKSQFFSSVLMPLMSFVSNIGYVIICILGGYMATRGRISLGDITAFIQYVRQFNQPISQVAQVTNILQSTAAAAERVFEFLSEEEESGEPENPALPSEVADFSVSFKNVSFGYDPERKVIKNFSADITNGSRVAIVGPTGAGKTTIVKLLMRFYDVDGGSISVGGRDVRDFSRNGLRSFFGMVLQDTWLFGGSIMENIRYGRLSATDDEVIAAAKAAHAHRFIKTLPGGYNMTLNEESTNVSQGQKQLLTIARCFLSDPRVLILDEATSSVDTRTEVLIQKAMDNLLRGRTSFIIAHRLSTIRDADLIFVMKNGDIIEQGGHQELIERKGFYYDLYSSQFEGKDI